MPMFFDEMKAVIKWRLRNIFIDPFYILYWDIWPSVKNRKKSTAFSSVDTRIKIPVTITTYKRPWYFDRTVASFINYNRPELDRFPIIVIVQGERDKDTEQIIEKYKEHIYKIIRPGVNLGCAAGYSLLMSETLALNYPYLIHLQDDFESREPLNNYIPELIELLSNNNNVGCIRLRSIDDKVNDYNVISRRRIKYIKKTSNVWVGNGHFTFNPTITKSTVIQKIIPTYSENDAQTKYQRLGLKTGQLYAKCFAHIGHERVNDWAK